MPSLVPTGNLISYVPHNPNVGPKIALALCTYKYIDAPCVANLINVATKGIINSYCITSGTIVQHARNDVTNTIYESCPEFTHILYVDSDQCDFNVESIDKLVKADKDVIAGVTVQRNKPHKVTLSPLQNHPNVTEEVIEVHHTGFFFTLVKRAVLDALAETLVGEEKKRVWFTCERFARAGFDKEMSDFIDQMLVSELSERGRLEEAIAFGRMATLHSTQVGEDVGFCWKAKLLGFKIWAHSGVRLGHIGDKVYHPNEFAKVQEYLNPPGDGEKK